MGIFKITFILASSLPTSPMVLRNCPREAHVSGVGFSVVLSDLREAGLTPRFLASRFSSQAPA